MIRNWILPGLNKITVTTNKLRFSLGITSEFHYINSSDPSVDAYIGPVDIDDSCSSSCESASYLSAFFKKAMLSPACQEMKRNFDSGKVSREPFIIPSPQRSRKNSLLPIVSCKMGFFENELKTQCIHNLCPIQNVQSEAGQLLRNCLILAKISGWMLSNRVAYKKMCKGIG